MICEVGDFFLINPSKYSVKINLNLFFLVVDFKCEFGVLLLNKNSYFVRNWIFALFKFDVTLNKKNFEDLAIEMAVVIKE